MNNKKDNNQKKQEPQEQDVNALKAELDVLKKEISEKDKLHDMYLRLQAEFDNYRKRTIKEKEEFVKYAAEGLIIDLVSTLDDFERGIKSAEQKKDFNLLHQGVDIISRQLHKMLEEKGLKRIKSVGEKFNPYEHEAVEVVESDEQEDGTVIEELMPGYSLNGRVIRPAKVRVAKGKEHRA